MHAREQEQEQERQRRRERAQEKGGLYLSTAKLLDYSLRSNKSNINQCKTHVHMHQLVGGEYTHTSSSAAAFHSIL